MRYKVTVTEQVPGHRISGGGRDDRWAGHLSDGGGLPPEHGEDHRRPDAAPHPEAAEREGVKPGTLYVAILGYRQAAGALHQKHYVCGNVTEAQVRLDADPSADEHIVIVVEPRAS
jgi:hypothetical protein